MLTVTLTDCPGPRQPLDGLAEQSAFSLLPSTGSAIELHLNHQFKRLLLMLRQQILCSHTAFSSTV